MNKSPNLIGKRFGLLMVKSMFHERDKLSRKIIKWVCICDCGNKRNVRTRELIHNITYSCGCKLYINPHKNKKYGEQEASFRAKVSTYKATAKSRNIIWDLTFDKATLLLKSNCHYCGRKPHKSFNLYDKSPRKFIKNKDKYQIYYNGIDRIDSRIGYVNDNVVSCCTICNFGKNNLTYNEFISWINDLIKYRTNENINN